MPPHRPLGTLALAALVSLATVVPGRAAEALRFATCFGPEMVLQRGMPVPIWGWADPQAEVTVSFGERAGDAAARSQRKATRADGDGRWRVVLDAMPAAAASHELRAESAGEAVVASDVVVGDVWLCAGPGIPRSMSGLRRPEPELAKATHPGVRILRPDSYTSIVPVADIPAPAEWVPVSPERIGPFSVAWYFGRELHLAEDVPVGLIFVNRAGMPREWIAWKHDPTDGSQRHALEQVRKQLPRDIERAESWLFQMARRRGEADPVDLLLFPCHIPFSFYNVHPAYGAEYPIGFKSFITFNACVGPLVPMAIRGVLFNCEFDEPRPVAADELERVVRSWREAWGRPGLPFVLAEPVTKRRQAASVHAAIAEAIALPAVSRAPAPVAFSEQDSEAYWKSLAAVAGQLPQELGAAVPPLEAWPAPTPVEARPAPSRRPLEAAHVFGDGMVVQRDRPIRIWGWCEPGERVGVSFAGETAEATTDAAGRWQVVLEARGASASAAELSIATATERLSFGEVVIGEVWVNSGQSNAGFVMSATLGFEEERPKATNRAIRCFFNAKAADVLPQRRNLGEWRVLSPETVGRMSGMGYYFARAINDELGVPVGIIEANHGGSTIFSWTTDAALASAPAFAELAAHRRQTREEALADLPLVERAVREWAAEARKNESLARPMMPFPIDASPVRPFYSAFLQNPMERRGCMFFNTMIEPMIGLGIRGVLWNQGESDGDKTAIYDDLMASMVADWRARWGDEFPFYFVQMPARKDSSGLLSMWQAQTRAVAKIPRSGMTVSNDVSEAGTPSEVHPRDKRTVGERLARLALVRAYGVEGMVAASPMMESVVRDGGRVAVTFSTPGAGLRTRDGKPADSWELAGADGRFVPATAEVAGARVVVTAAGVAEPAAVRLGWRSDSDCNLVNSAGLPALPFTAAVGDEGSEPDDMDMPSMRPHQ